MFDASASIIRKRKICHEERQQNERQEMEPMRAVTWMLYLPLYAYLEAMRMCAMIAHASICLAHVSSLEDKGEVRKTTILSQ